METYKLAEPIQFGSETITSFEFKPCARAFRGYSQQVKPDGSVVYEPYPLALVMVRMAGKPDPVADFLSLEDMNRLAQKAMSFLGRGLQDGNAH